MPGSGALRSFDGRREVGRADGPPRPVPGRAGRLTPSSCDPLGPQDQSHLRGQPRRPDPPRYLDASARRQRRTPPAMPAITVDPETTAARYAALAEYVGARVLGPGGDFRCEHARDCRSSIRESWRLYEGQCSYLGPHYDAADGDGRSMRILVVSMQTGRPDRHVDLEGRRLQVWGSRDRPNRGPGSRNPHMRGVATALKVLWGIRPDSGDDGEWLPTNEGRVHLFDALAMANATLCSRIKEGSAKGQGSKTMLDRCATHLRETVRILDPTIIHSQGRREGGPSTHSAVLAICDEIDWISEYVARVRIGATRAVWVSLRHPSMQWGGDYLESVVVPALERARGWRWRRGPGPISRGRPNGEGPSRGR